MDRPEALLIGEALVDHLPTGSVVGGAPLNVACHLQSLGVDALLISRVGLDPAGHAVRDALWRRGLAEAGLQLDMRRPTGTVDVEMDATGHRFRIASDVAWDAIDEAAVLALVRSRPPKLVVFGTLAQRSNASRAAVRAALGATAALRFLDLNLRDGVSPELALESLRLAHWAKLNDDELAQVLVWSGQPDAAALCAHLKLRRLVVTRGAGGYTAFGEAPATGAGVQLDQFVDSVGAGDAFSACLLAAHLQGKAWAPALALANRFAAAICGQAGASPSDPAVFYPPWQAALAALPEIAP